jgi:2-polyprenyl-3-methyl-5-hydroxy-6-metoxy-1,4-benzoquinol methylase
MEKFLQYMSGAFNVFAIYIGDRLGLYRTLFEQGPLTSSELASLTSTNERYIREWLEQQTINGVFEVEDEQLGSTERRYRLPPGHAELLIECSSLNYMAPLAQLFVGATHPLPALLQAYRDGGGVPYAEYGTDLREGQAAINYPAFFHQLPEEWLPAVPDLHARLQADPPARIADIGCGFGWSSIGMARGYPKVQVDGFDLDEPSIDRAIKNAQMNGLAGRVRFLVQDASDPGLSGQYDLVTAFECVHDMADPVGALKTIRRLAGERGTVLIVDERVGDTFTASGNDVEWMMYGWSILHCLPVGMAEDHGVGTGTVLRTDTLRDYASEAGFRKFEVLPIDNFFFRFYRLNA